MVKCSLTSRESCCSSMALSALAACSGYASLTKRSPSAFLHHGIVMSVELSCLHTETLRAGLHVPEQLYFVVYP